MKQAAHDHSTPAGDQAPAWQPEPVPAETTSEFICQGCGKTLHLTLHSDMCFAEALVFCPECERDYQEQRGRWAADAEQ